MLIPITPDVFRSKIAMQADDAQSAAVLEKLEIQSRASKNGAYGGSAMSATLAKAAHARADEFTDQIFGELERAIGLGLDPLDAFNIADAVLEATLPRIAGGYKVAGNSARRVPVEDTFRVDKIMERYRKRLMHAKSGLAGAATPIGVSNVYNSNTINAQNAIGIQQGSHGSSQQINVSLNRVEMLRAVDEMEAEIRQLPASDEVVQALSELATIRAQAIAPKPNRTILFEAGKTLRSLTEGILAGAMTPAAVSAATAIFGAIF